MMTMDNNTQDLIKGRDIVIVGQQPWDIEIGSNCKNLALEFSRFNRVLYVNSPLDRITLMRHKDDAKIKKRLDVIRGETDGLVRINKSLWNYYPDELIESINWIKSIWLHTNLNKLNNRRLAHSIKKATSKLGFKDYILFNDNDIFRCFYLKEYLRPALNVYYSRDFMLAVDYWKLHGIRLEPQLIAKSDVCVANSVYLAEYCQKYNPNSYYVGQGCDLDVFTGFYGSKPADISRISGPMIGYVGALQSIRLDMDLIKYIATERSGWNIVLVGPEDKDFIASDLHQLPNVHFLGGKSPELLPAYINAFDVCLNPQLVNQVTIGNYPRKIDEYLAMGKPVVATRTEAMSVFENHTYLANSGEDYVNLIERALVEDTNDKRKERIDFAASHTWENNAKEIYKAINQVQ